MPTFDGRPERQRMFPPVTMALVGINVAIFLLASVPYSAVIGGQYEVRTLGELFIAYGALWPVSHPLFQPWQYFSYMFLHSGFMHIFFNMFVLWMFGNMVEQSMGARRYLMFYIICGLGAGVLHTLITSGSGIGGPTLGASGAISGVTVAFAMAYPDTMIFLMMFPMRAKYAVLVILALDVFQGFSGGDNIAHFAHIGGAITGFLLVALTNRDLVKRIFSRNNKGGIPVMRPTPRGQVIDANFREVSPPMAPRVSPTVMHFGSEQPQVDAILDKISHSGYQSLTDSEKELLKEVSRKMG